jgi:hypothetical protein
VPLDKQDLRRLIAEYVDSSAHLSEMQEEASLAVGRLNRSRQAIHKYLVEADVKCVVVDGWMIDTRVFIDSLLQPVLNLNVDASPSSDSSERL